MFRLSGSRINFNVSCGLSSERRFSYVCCLIDCIPIIYLTPYGSICRAFSRLSLVSSTEPESRLLRVAFLPDNRWPFHPLRLMTLPVPVIFILLAVLFRVFNFVFTLAFAISYPPPKISGFCSILYSNNGRTFFRSIAHCSLRWATFLSSLLLPWPRASSSYSFLPSGATVPQRRRSAGQPGCGPAMPCRALCGPFPGRGT